jgi:nitrogen regulatory protein P-II 1
MKNTWAWIFLSTVNGSEVIIMKMVKAIIKPEQFDIVKKALEDYGVTGMTVTEVQGRGEQKGITLEYRGKPMVVDMLPKIQIEIVIRDQEVDNLITTIMSAARTGMIGDGKIFVLPVETAIRVRTGEMEH